ncbi:MAG: peptidylprolyl isomerase [Nanoarchaeota archaeon]
MAKEKTPAKSSEKVAAIGDKVTIEYTGTLDDGTQFDTSVGKEPLQFQLGSGEVIPGFEKGITGMALGEQKTLKITPEDAYGPHHEKLVQEVPKDKFPAHVELKKGLLLTMKAPTGQVMMAKIAEVKETTAMLDLNHPLAGMTLHFKVKLLAIN